MANWISARRLDDYALLAGLVLGCLVLLTLFADYRASAIAQGDFGIIWSGPRAILDGIDPYDPAAWTRERLRYGFIPTNSPVYAYPPWVAIALIPLGALPFDTAAAVWTVLGILLAALAVRALLRAYVPGLPVLHSAFGFVLFASQPGVATFFSGQFGFVLVAAVSAAILMLRGRHPTTGGLATLVFLAKPQYFVFAGWGFVRAAVALNQSRFVIAAIAGGGAVLLGSALVAGQGLTTWVRGVGPVALGDPTATTLPAALADLIGAPGVVLAVALMFGVIGVGLRFDPRGDGWLAVWVTLSSLCATYARSYDQIVLVAPLIVASGVLARRSRRLAIVFGVLTAVLFGLGSLLLYGIAALRQREDTSVALTATLFVLIVSFLWKQRRELRLSPTPES
jgi:glycosyl transferase family 87